MNIGDCREKDALGVHRAAVHGLLDACEAVPREAAATWRPATLDTARAAAELVATPAMVQRRQPPRLEHSGGGGHGGAIFGGNEDVAHAEGAREGDGEVDIPAPHARTHGRSEV